MMTWILDNPRRLRKVVTSTVLAAMLLFFGFTISRVHGIPQVPAETTSAAAAGTPESTATVLLPPSPATEQSPAPQTYGPSAPIALEAVQAFLSGDHAGFALLGQQEAVEAVNEAPKPPPGQEITGPVKVIHGGPTRQQVQVPTTDGPLLLDMIVVDEAWKVQSMEYQR